MIVTKLQPPDYDQWLPLWQANMEHKVTQDVTALTWDRICDIGFPIEGMAARNAENGPITGILHYVVHPTTGNAKLVCYMQDLYVDPAARRQGVARNLVANLAALGKIYGWARIYWLAESRNEAAQALYKNLGLKLDFTLHVLPI